MAQSKDSVLATGDEHHPGGDGRSPDSRLYRNYVLILLLAMNALAIVDRSIINVLNQPIKADLGLSDTQIGVLSGLAFMAVYTLAALPLARLAERVNRVGLIASCVAFWSVATAAGGIATSYTHLLLSRIFVGAGEAGATPTAHSIIGDYFPFGRRGSAISIFVLGLPLGTMLGSIVGGYVAEYFSWRVALMTVGIPGLLLALLIRFTVREPVRGGADHGQQAKGPPPSFMMVLRHLQRRRSFFLMVAGFTLASFATSGVYVFLPSILVRRFEIGVGLSGLIFGILGGVCTAVGVLAAGHVNDILVKRDHRWFAWIPGATFGAMIPLMVVGVLQNSALWMAVFLILPFFLKSAYLPGSLAAFHNMVEPRMRATTITIVFMTANIIGSGGGPVFAGYFSDLFAKGQFVGSYGATCTAAVTHNICRSADAYGASIGVSITLLVGIIAVLCFQFAARSIREDFVK